MELKKENPFKIKTPKRVPPKSDNITFFEYSAKIIARRDGTTEIIESSIRTT